MIEVTLDGPAMDPGQAGTQTFGAIAAKGAGKSYLAGVFAEQFAAAHVPFIVIDPIGNWSALTIAADGKSPGLSIAVVGGEHGDVPLEATQGEALGRYVVEADASAVIDVSAFSKNQRKQFAADFCEALYRAARMHRMPRMLILEEAQLFAPQHTQRGEERMLGAVTDIVRLGRNYGIGSMLVTQRPQSVSKEVLNQVECLFVGALRGPQERKAIAGWVTEVGEAAGGIQLRAHLEQLPQLTPGEFFQWSPSWLKFAGRVRVGKKWTFDGSSTPTLEGNGQALRRETTSVDLDALRALLDPPPVKTRAGTAALIDAGVELESRYAEVVTELDEANQRAAEAEHERDEAKLAREQVDAMLNNWIHDLQTVVDETRKMMGHLDELVERMTFGGVDANTSSPAVDPDAHLLPGEKITFGRKQHPPPAAGAELVRNSRSKDGSRSSNGASPRENAVAKEPKDMRSKAPGNRERPIAQARGSAPTPGGDYVAELLAVIAAYGPVQRVKLSLLSGKSRKSSTFADAIRGLINAGKVEETWDGLTATIDGKLQADDPTLAKGRAVLDWWRANGFDNYERETFDALVEHRRTGLTREQVAEATGHSKKSSTFADALRRLARLGICNVPKSGPVTLTADARDAMGL